MEKKKWWIPYVIAGILLLAGTFYDYPITAYLYDPDNVFGIIMQRYVTCFFIAGIAFVFAILLRIHKNFLFLIAQIFFSVYAAAEGTRYVFSIYEHTVLVVMLGIAVMALCNMIVYRMPVGRVLRMEKKAVFYACVLITSCLIAAVIKHVWGRVRFRELEHAAQFTIWFLPQGVNGYHSFPSGHTITMSSLLCLFVTLKDCEKHQIPWYVGVFVFGAIIAMAVSRMIMGAHYLSDAAAGFLIAYTVFLCYRHYFYRKRYL